MIRQDQTIYYHSPLSNFFEVRTSLATRAQGPHPFPSRTRPLSPAAPMVLRPRGRGRVGRRRHLIPAPRNATALRGAVLCAPDALALSTDAPAASTFPP